MKPWKGAYRGRPAETRAQSLDPSNRAQATRQPTVSWPAQVEIGAASRAAGEDGTALVASPGPTMDELKELLELLLGDIRQWQRRHSFPDLPPALVLSQVAAMFSVDPRQ